MSTSNLALIRAPHSMRMRCGSMPGICIAERESRMIASTCIISFALKRSS